MFAANRGQIKGRDGDRNVVLLGLALKAIELFSDWEGKHYPKDKNDRRNLRCDLRGYIAAAQNGLFGKYYSRVRKQPD